MKKILTATAMIIVMTFSLWTNVFAESGYDGSDASEEIMDEEARTEFEEYLNSKGMTLEDLLKEPEEEVFSEMEVKTYPDVNTKSWYYNAVKYVAEKSIMTGYNNGYFGPDNTITREQFITILYRMSGEEASNNDTSVYTDTKEGTYYNEALVWARENNIAKGYYNEDGSEKHLFGIGDPIKRQDIVTMLYRYAEHVGYQTKTRETLSQFSDYGYVSSYAVNSLKWAVSIGVITGKSNGTKIDSKGFATRAEAATMIMRYLKIKEYFSEDGTGWTVTQNAEQSGSYGMFYTLFNNEDGYLIVIDSGTKDNYEKVRRILNIYGGHVNTWIITHPHQDHLCAFLEIMKHPEGIIVDKTYASPYDNNYFAAGGWTCWQNLLDFNALFAKNKNNRYIYRNDTFEIDGLKFECFNSFDNISKKYSSSLEALANNGSLVLKVTGNKDTFLFLGDVQSSMGSYLIDTYGDRLKADYVQLAHHGNSGDSKWKLYNRVLPKIAFMDAPEWLFERDEYRITWNYVQSLGAKCYRFASAPNHITFR